MDGPALPADRTLQGCPAWVTCAAPPAGSPERCSRATSGLSSQDSGWRSTGFLAFPPGPDHHVVTKPGHSFVLPAKMFSDKAFVPFLMWVKCGARDDFFKKGTSQFSHAGEPLSNNERPWGCDLCLLGAQP